MEKAADKMRVNYMILLFMVTYLVSYITRVNFGAIIAEIETETNISRPLLSLSLMGSFITYGAGQIISGICGDRFQPKKLVLIGLLVTSLMNLMIPFCRTPGQMVVIWCINGFAQAFLWPPIVRMMAALFSEEDYKRASVIVSFGSSLGTIAVYLVSPVVISLANWKGVFWGAAGCGVIMALVWQKLSCEISQAKPKPHLAETEKRSGLFTPLLCLIMLAIACQGALRDGVTTWMPSYISETYHWSSSVSILSGVLLPVFSLLCFQGAALLYRKAFRNPLLCAGVIFGTGAVAATLLFFFSGKNAAGSVVFSALLAGCMNGVNLILICMLPPYFKRNGKVATVSGLLNSCTYVGSAISTYGIALLSDSAGWNATLFVWIIIAAAGTIICMLCIPRWKRFCTEEDKSAF
jgi:OPA family glycerol-3-phosphate transporter-like MFS transporter